MAELVHMVQPLLVAFAKRKRETCSCHGIHLVGDISDVPEIDHRRRNIVVHVSSQIGAARVGNY